MKRSWRSTVGATAVEMAVILPAFLLLIMGVMEGGRILGAWVILTNESREAARYGVAGNLTSRYDTNPDGLTAEVTVYATSRIGAPLAQ